jgi:hypothetical protein
LRPKIGRLLFGHSIRRKCNFFSIFTFRQVNYKFLKLSDSIKHAKFQSI